MGLILKKQSVFLLILLLILSLLICVSPAQAAEEAANPAPLWTDLSYSKYLLRNIAFYQLDDQVLQAEDMAALIKALQEIDPWAQYYTPEEYSVVASDHEGDFVGIGVYLRLEEGRVMVVGTIAGSAAEKSGLKNGDFIVEVDGKNMREASLSEMQQALRGEENTLVTLKYERKGKLTELMMTRKRITAPSMEYWLMENNIGYLRIEQFTSHTGEELRAGLNSLKKQGMIAAIIDLRNCPGGLVEGAVDASAVLAGGGPMVFYVDNQGWLSFDAIDGAQPWDQPLALLINQNTASAAELLAANIQDAAKGQVIGDISFGKGVVQSMVKLPSGAGISFTSGKYISRGYQDIDEQGGVVPDIYEPQPEAQQQRAEEWLQQQLEQPGYIKFYATLSGHALGNTWQNSGARLLLEEGNSYVPLRLTLTELGWQLKEDGGLLYASRGNQRLIVDIAAQQLIGAGGSHQLLSQNGLEYLPAALLRQYGHSVIWDEAQRSVCINK